MFIKNKYCKYLKILLKINDNEKGEKYKITTRSKKLYNIRFKF